MIHLFNFRPLCWLALIVIISVVASMVSLWLTLGLGVVLCLVLSFVPVPTQFKVVAVVVYLLAATSFAITTVVNPNPYYHTYNPQAGLRGIILRYADWYLHKFLKEDNATLIYTMLFGDKQGLPLTLRQDFTIAGLAHVLTVSGLHVTLLATVIATLLKLCHLPKRAQIFVITPILLFYAYLCGWQYAILRAVIMCLVYLLARYHLQLADTISALSCAAIVILLIFPYALTSASFLLSFSCVLGIDFFYDKFYGLCCVKTMAMYGAVTVGSLPFIIYFFGALPLLGLLGNVILLPLLVIAFYAGMLAVSTFAFGAILWLVAPLLNFVRWATTTIAQVPGATLMVHGSLPAALLYLGGLVILSRYIFLRPRLKYPLAVTLIACYFLLLMF